MVMFVRELLNERMIKCYDFTIQVVAKYKELFSIGFSQECDLALYSDCIEEIRELVIQEEQLYGNSKCCNVCCFDVGGTVCLHGIFWRDAEVYSGGKQTADRGNGKDRCEEF